MNATRRKELNALQDRIIKLKDSIAAIAAFYVELDEIKGELENVRDNEQEAHDNTRNPDMQADMESAIENMDQAISNLESFDEFDGVQLADDLDSIVENIEDAKGMVDG